MRLGTDDNIRWILNLRKLDVLVKLCHSNVLLSSTRLIANIQYDFYPRDAMLAQVIVIATCPSVRPSVTRRYCVKTKKASGMISSPSGSPKTLVF